MTEGEPVLRLERLQKYFEQGSLKDSILGREPEPVKAVDEVTIDLHENESIGVIGESGCGKTTLLRTLMGLYRPTGGEMYFNGEPTSEFSKNEWQKYRRNVQIIFQDPFNSLDPKFTVRDTLKEPLQVHGLDNHEERMHDVLEEVQLNPPEQYIDRFPKQLSGGEKQRVSIARALILEPEVILADEPVSMLDVSTQASILTLLSNLMEDRGLSMFYISHDLSTVSYICDEINVMYLGRVVERAPTKKVLRDPKHPYSQALIDAIPVPDPHYDRDRTKIEGAALDPVDMGDGCRFRDRCPERMDICEKKPRFVDVDDESIASCHLYYDHESDDVAADIDEQRLAPDSTAPGAEAASKAGEN